MKTVIIVPNTQNILSSLPLLHANFLMNISCHDEYSLYAFMDYLFFIFIVQDFDAYRAMT